MNIKKILLGFAMMAVVAVAGFGVWFMFFHTTPATTNPSNQPYASNTTQTFGTGSGGAGQTPTTNQPLNTTVPPNQKIFKLAAGPVESVTFVQTTNPTTTLARYVMQDSGHVFDIPVEVPGAIARVVSNTTIPGLGGAQWLAQGTGAVLQYADAGIVKSVYLGFSTNAASTSVRVHFLPDNVSSLAVSPDGKSIVYLLTTATGSSGYLARADGTSAVKLFSSPLSQLVLSWPANNTLLLQTKEAAGVPGMAFSVSTKDGTITPLLYTSSLSAITNSAFSKIVYQTAEGSTPRQTYAHDMASGKDYQLPFNPLPEKCIWSPKITTLMYCAAPLQPTPANYLDLWHQGVMQAVDSIFAFDIASGVTTLIGLPGSSQGGTSSSIVALAVSSDGQYLAFITKGDRTLWGVRLTQ